MKNIVTFDEYNGIDFKPLELFQKYIDLTKKDIKDILIGSNKYIKCNCPGCASTDVLNAFKKFGLNYMECIQCNTCYVSPRPCDNNLDNYYRQAPSRIYWRDKFSVATGKKRKEKIVKPRFQWILESAQEFRPDTICIADINTSGLGYVEEMAEGKFFKRKILINPFLELRGKTLGDRIEIINSSKWASELENQVDVVSIFEVADRTSDVDGLFENIRIILKDQGLCFITAILMSGFDLLTLRENANNLFPPDRLNVFTVEGLKALFDRHGFDCLEFSTPGILDIENIIQAVNQNPEIRLPKFLDYLIKKRDIEHRRAFQDFLQENLLSSYGRILLRKIGAD